MFEDGGAGGHERCPHCFKQVPYTFGMSPNMVAEYCRGAPSVRVPEQHTCEPPTTWWGWVVRFFTGK